MKLFLHKNNQKVEMTSSELMAYKWLKARQMLISFYRSHFTGEDGDILYLETDVNNIVSLADVIDKAVENAWLNS